MEVFCAWARANGPKSCYPATKDIGPHMLVNEALDASGQDDRDQEDKGLLDEINDRILAEAEQGSGETDR